MSAQRSMLVEVVRQGTPLALGMASHVLFNLVDLVLVGRLGGAGVAGVHVATTINFLPMIVGNGLSVATMSIMARLYGAGRTDEARTLSARTQWWMLWLGVVLGALGAALTVPCVDLQGVTGEARDVGIHYLLVSSIGTVTMFVLMQTTASMRVVGESLMPFALLVGSNALNLVLDVVLLFGWDAAGIPALGAPGAAYATVISRLVGAAVGVWWLARPGHPLRLSLAALRAGVETGRRHGREMLRLGLPQSLQMLARASAAVALTRFAADLGGEDAVIALGVATRLDTMVLFSAVGFASAGTTIVGTACGAGDTAGARRACRIAGLAALVFGGGLVAAFALSARPLIELFVAEAGPGVVAAGSLYLCVAGPGNAFAALCIAATGGINGAGRVLAPVVIDLVGFVGVLLPVGIVVVAQGGPLVAVWWLYTGIQAALALSYVAVVEGRPWLAGARLPE